MCRPDKPKNTPRANASPCGDRSPIRYGRKINPSLPTGADAVQQVEKTQPLDEFRVTILARVDERQNVAPRGSEVREGERVLERGRVVDASAIGVLAATG